MFTGIIQTIGTITECKKSGGHAEFVIECGDLASRVVLGSSVAVQGVCLTVKEKQGTELVFDAMEETLKKTTLGFLKQGLQVNLEPALRVGDELGGHFVYGHVNAVGTVSDIVSEEASTLVSVSLLDSYRKYVVPEGSITIDGVSLTIARIEGSNITVSLVPYTSEHTTLGSLEKGTQVNIEVDMLAKYTEKILRT